MQKLWYSVCQWATGPGNDISSTSASMNKKGRAPLGYQNPSGLLTCKRSACPPQNWATCRPISYAVTRSLLFYLAHGPVKAARLAQTRSPFEGERRAQRTAPRTPWPDSRGAGPKGWTRTARRDAGVGRGTRKGGGGHARWGWALRPSIRGPAGRGGARRSSAATWVRGSARLGLGSARGGGGSGLRRARRWVPRPSWRAAERP